MEYMIPQSLVTELNDKIEECFAVKDGEEENSEGGAREGAVLTPRACGEPRATPRRKPAQRRNKRRSSSSPEVTLHLFILNY